ncbi:hypothetical protein TrLO_g13039 [Triparma laevis f. longispina]|nr:hypothetical protein TrLO_g13039 [Triparma laevis f. longispina]
MKNLREVSSGFNKKVDRVVVRDYFEVVTRSIGGLGEVNSLVESSIDTAPVLLPWGKGMIIQEWKRKDTLWKYLCKGWGISTQKMLDEANKQRRGFNVKPIVEAVAGLGVILLDPDWHEQTLMDKYEIYTKVEHSIWNFTGGRAGRQRSEGQTMGVEMREKFAKRREGLFHLILKSTEMTYASIVFKLLTPEKRLVYENISELLKSWRSSQGNLHICKELRNASKIYEAVFRLICNVMDAAKSIEDYMRVRESGYDGMKEIIYKEGHRQARTHLEHHQLLNLMNLLEKQEEATKSFKKWYKRVKAKERALVERAERRKLLYSQERSRADSAGFRVRGRTESEPLFEGSDTE